MCVHQALFLGEERRRSLARHGEGGRKVENVKIHGGMEGNHENGGRMVKKMKMELRENGEEREK